MAQFLRFDNTDQHIIYNDGWSVIPNPGAGQIGSYSLTSTINAQLFFLFRGIVHSKWRTRYFFSSSWSLIRLSPLRFKRPILWPFKRRGRTVGVQAPWQRDDCVAERDKL